MIHKGHIIMSLEGVGREGSRKRERNENKYVCDVKVEGTEIAGEIS